MGCTILVADVDPLLGEHVTDELKFHGYQVTTAMDGPSALKFARCLTPDLIILDLMLPEMDGLTVCRQLRRTGNTATTPIIMISARGDEIDLVVSLEVGADAFLTKPISHRELLARIRVLLRRTGSSCVADSSHEELIAHSLPSSKSELVVGPLRIDLNGRFVTCRGKKVDMPNKEFELLVYLARRPEMALDRDQLLLDIWGKEYQGPRRAVDMHIGKLRRKFERDPKTHRLFQTVFNVGYCFMPDEQIFVKGS
jgi:DNA-binding response OmpR family regulator